MQSFFKVLAVGMFVGMCGCSGGGVTLPPGSQCTDPYQPILMSANNGQQAITANAVKNKASQTMVPGVYTYLVGDLFYTQLNKPNPYMIQVRDGVVADVSTAQVAICQRNASSVMTTMTKIHAETDGVTDITVCPDYTQFVTTRHYILDITNGTITFVPSVLPPLPSRTYLPSPDQAYPQGTVGPSGKLISSILLRNPNSYDFEIRSEVDAVDNSFQYFLAIHMTWAPYVSVPGGVCVGHETFLAAKNQVPPPVDPTKPVPQ